MNTYETNSHFANIPVESMPRSIFHRPLNVKTSGNVADLIPIFLDAGVMAGDTIEMKISSIIRLQTMLTPIMDNIYADITAWAVPYRLVWSHFKEFMGENTQSAWIPQVTYQFQTQYYLERKS